MWLNSMHRCAGVHGAMSNLTGAQHKTSEQHIELGKSRVKKDNEDLMKLLTWFQIHDPFDINVGTLRSISSGITASEEGDINCDDAENVGKEIQKQNDNITVEDASIKRKARVKTLQSLQPGVKIDKKTVHIDPTILFTRLTAILQGEEDIAEQFRYELTPEPTSLFKEGMMRKVQKSNLRNYILDMVPSCECTDAEVCVVDGGALLHKVSWQSNSKYNEVANQYVSYVKTRYKKYAKVCVVFDGYTDEYSIKSQEHLRRTGLMSANINITSNMVVTTTREVFLKNQHNKEQFISLLSSHLEASGYEIVKSDGDADVLIVEKALENAVHSNVVVAADDTDILVLLVYHFNVELHNMYFSTEKKEQRKSKTLKWWSISSICERFPDKDTVLFGHAWSGCDTTSGTHNKGNR